jgi:rubredoxin
MEETSANLDIELNVLCPHCSHYFDLFFYNNQELDIDGRLINQACPNGSYWAASHRDFEEDITCPECELPMS